LRPDAPGRYASLMPKTFTTWTVLPHQPIERISDNLWRVSGTLKDGKIQRQMVLARMTDGRVIVHNAIAMGDAEMRALEAWGTPAVLFVPNGFHRQDAAVWKERYPKMVVVTPRGARKRVAQVVPVDAGIEEAPGDDSARILPLQGVPSEGILQVRSGGEVSLVFCDAVLNVPRRHGVMGFVLAPTGEVSAPRLMRWIGVKNRGAFAAQLDELAGTAGVRRLMFGHGAPITDDAPAALRKVASQLRS
jgi:hypothetical protein